MHDRFEKEVQKKMEELQLRPSAPVWEKIEMEITPERKRRRVIAWLFFGLLFLSGGLFVYQIIQKDSATIVEQQAPNVSVPPTKTFDSQQDKVTHQPANPVIEVPNENAAETVLVNPQLSTEKKSKAPVLVEQHKKGSVKRATTDKGTFTATTQPSNNVPSDNENTPLTDKSNPTKENTIVNKEKVPSIVDEAKPKDSLSTALIATKQDSIVTNQPEKTETSQPVIDSGLKKKVAVNKAWKKGISFSVGRSDYTTASLSKSVVTDAMYQSPGPSPISSGNTVYRPATTAAGVSFAVGVAFTKKLTEHLALSIGAQYAYYSTQTNVGSQRRRDTTVVYNSASMTTNRFYTNTANEAYTNQFHAVELPVTLSYKPSAQLPLYVSVGAAYGRILSTNALTFSRNSNVYYENKENYLRNTLPVFSSVQVELFAKKKLSLRIGPALQYNLLKVQKEASSGASHLFFAGIKGGINF